MGDTTGFLGTETTTPPPADTTVVTPVNTNWDANAKYPEGIDESIKGDVTLKAFVNADGQFNVPNIMKTLVHQQKMIGRDKILVPGKGASESEWSEVYHKLGLPKDPNEYKVEAPEQFKDNADFVKKFSETAYKNGVMPKQAQAILNYYNESIAESNKAHVAAEEAKYKESVANLQKEWGEAYTRKLHTANKALENFTDEDTRKYIASTGLLNDPQITKLFVKIGEALGEDKVFEGTSKTSFGATPDELDAQIMALHAKDGPLSSKMHPGYQAALVKYRELLIKRHGNGPLVGMPSQTNNM